MSEIHKNILITGGCGFLGKHVVRSLSGQPNTQITVLDALDPLCGAGETIPDACIDVRDFHPLETYIIGKHITDIVHLAAYGRNLTCQDHPREAWEVNVNGTLNVLEIARLHPKQINRVICISSNIALSDQLTVYRETKLAVERLVEIYAGKGVSCLGLRPSNIHGSGQSRTEYQLCAFAGLDRGYEKTGHLTVSGDGTQSRDWIHAKDVARAIELSLSNYPSGITLDICTGKQTSINEIADMLEVPIVYGSARQGDAKQLISNPIPARDLLGFTSQLDLDKTIYHSFPAVLLNKLKSQ